MMHLTLHLYLNFNRDERLKMTAFTLPLLYDKTYLVIPKPGTVNSLGMAAQRALAPFAYSLWAFVLLTIVIAAALSMWFTKEPNHSTNGNRSGQRESRRITVMTNLRLSVDSFIEKGIVSLIG